MVKYISRVKNQFRTIPDKPTKQMATKVVNAKKAVPKPIAANIPTGGTIPVAGSIPVAGKISAKQAEGIKKVIAKATPILKNVVKKIKQVHVARAGIPMGGAFQAQAEPLSDSAIDQLDPHVFTHMLNNMDMPTHHILKGIASNFLGVEHPLRLITKKALGGDFKFPKHLSRIAMRDIMKANSPQQLAGALHSEIVDMQSGKLSREEMGGGLFSSLKTLVKRGIKGARTALGALGKGAASAVKAIASGAKGAQHIGKSVSNALMQGIDVANALSPIITDVFPASEGVIRSGIGHANALKELSDRGINVASQVQKVTELDPVQKFVQALGKEDDPVIPLKQPETPIGAGLDLSNADVDGSDVSGPRFVS